MAAEGRRSTSTVRRDRPRGNNGGGNRRRRDAQRQDNEGIMPVLARAVREVEAKAQRGPLDHQQRTRFHAIGLMVRDERARAKTDTTITDAERAELVKRLEGVATILAKTATRDPSLFTLLADDVEPSSEVRAARREMEAAGGVAQPVVEPEAAREVTTVTAPRRQVVPQSAISRQLANPFLAPDFSNVAPRESGPGRLSSWELLGPLFASFEKATDGVASCMELPEAEEMLAPSGLPLMKHQTRLVESAEDGHRTFLLADEPGLGKTAQALLAADATDAFPLLVVAPNVVKANWAREVERWIPGHPATVLHGDGDDLDAFADVVIVNYEILDRHVGWLGEFGFRGMVVDEAHFIKNKTSQRSKQVLALAEKIRERNVRPLMLALTGTPLINSVEDFRAIWQFLGWIDDKRPREALMAALERTGLTPQDPGFAAAARRTVIDQGIVRRRKIDVAADIPARRIADITVDLDDDAERSIRAAERELVQRLLARYDAALEVIGAQGSDRIDEVLIGRIAKSEREDAQDKTKGENVFSVMRRIGQAKAGLAADYAAQLAGNVGKVVFFAKHNDVMDAAEELFAQRGIRYSSIRGGQTSAVRERNVEAFVNDPDVKVIVCSVSAAGVGINLQVASDVVLAELSWTDAEQTQAIDRVHRIGQDEPVTAWRILAARTIDGRVADLVDGKAGLAAQALDGIDVEEGSEDDLQAAALARMLSDALHARLR